MKIVWVSESYNRPGIETSVFSVLLHVKTELAFFLSGEMEAINLALYAAWDVGWELHLHFIGSPSDKKVMHTAQIQNVPHYLSTTSMNKAGREDQRKTCRVTAI